MLSNKLIISLLQLPKVGRKTALKICDSINYNIRDTADFVDFIKENPAKLKLPEFSTNDFEQAFDKAEFIIERSNEKGVRFVSFYEHNYPSLLKLTGTDAPLILSYKGDITSLNKMPSVAIIGTREPSEKGAKIGERLGVFFGSHGLNVVSGLAVGCDTAGHKGCLDGNGITSAVLAHGIDSIYPKENKYLADKIVETGGVLLSEYFINQRPMSNFFVERDRIQAGLSLCVFVVETDIKGGTMHTVKFAEQYGRLLAAFQHTGSLLNHPKAQGNQYLINSNRAIPVADSESLQSILAKITSHSLIKNNDSSAKSEWVEIKSAISKVNNTTGEQLSIF